MARIRRLIQILRKATRSGLRSLSQPRRRPDCSTFKLFVQALEKRGIAFSYLNGIQIPVEFRQWSRGRCVKFCAKGNTYYYTNAGDLFVANALESARVSWLLVWRKDVTNSILRRHGFSVPEGANFYRRSFSEACAYFAALLATSPLGICVKPTKGSFGYHVHVGVFDMKIFSAAFNSVAKKYDQILVEEVVTGFVFRFFCLAGRVIAIRYGVPPSVEGDGVHTIAELIRIKNKNLPAANLRRKIRVGRRARSWLTLKGIDLETIPNAGEFVLLNQLSNLEQGAAIVDATGHVHSSYIALVERAVQKFPGLALYGVDVAIENCRVAATSTNHHFLELNAAPGFEGHHFPTSGVARDIAGSIVAHLLGDETD